MADIFAYAGRAFLSGYSADPLRLTAIPGVHGAVHPQYRHYFQDWLALRDSVEGERAIKARSYAYLPMRQGQDPSDYQVSLDRAIYFPATARTIEGLYGSVFRRPTLVESEGIDLTSFTFGGEDFYAMVGDVVEEVLTVGRIGALVEYPAGTVLPNTQPYVETYFAENILNWSYVKSKLLAVKLMESRPSGDVFNSDKASTQCRLLALDEDGFYFQAVSETGEEFDASISAIPMSRRVYPLIRGKRLNYVPFYFINTNSTWPDVRKPPVMDICNLNLAHYRSYALLETARYFSATPIYWVKGKGAATSGSDTIIEENEDGTRTHVRNDEGPQFRVGANTIWLLDENDECGITEYKGQGLASLEKGLEVKEGQIQAMGGKLVGQRREAASKSAVGEDLTQQGEEAILLKMVQTISSGLTRILKEVGRWKSLPESSIEKISVVVNQQFVRPKIGAREVRALQSLFEAGLSPEDSTYQILQESGLLSADISLEDFKDTVEEFRKRKEDEKMKVASARSNAAPTPPKGGKR